MTLPPIDDLRAAALLLWEWSCRLDEPLRARQLLEALPYVLEHDPALAERRMVTDRMLRHLASPEAYAAFYDGIWESEPPQTREAIVTMGAQCHRAQWALAVCREVGAERVLDLGCGDGTIALSLAAQGLEVVGVNLTARAAAAARRVAESLDLPAVFVSEAAEVAGHQRIDGHRADVVIAFEIIEHVVNPQALIGAMEAATISGGTCLLSTPNGSTTLGEDTWATRDANGGALGDPVAHVRAFTPTRLQALVPTAAITTGPGPAAGTLYARWRVE